MNMSYTPEKISKGIIDVVNSNQLEPCYIHPIIFIDSQKLGISLKNNNIHTIIAPWDWGAYPDKGSLNKEISVKTSSFNRRFISSSPVRAKAHLVTISAPF